MNIISEILSCISSPPSGRDFAFSSATNDVKMKFAASLADFLMAPNYYEREHRCGEIYDLMLELHDKVPVLWPTIERSNNQELFGAYSYSGQRLHFCHQAYVFLLGLFIYHNFEPVRKELEREMRDTTTEIECPDGSFFRFSGGDEFGEFLYRWRLSSMCHDMGTGIQLCEGDRYKISDSLRRLPFQKTVSSIEELRVLGDHDLLVDIENASGAVGLAKYMEYQNLKPHPGNVHHDHGIIAGMIFLRLMHEAYARHKDTPISVNVAGMKVFWHPRILAHSIVQIAKTIALHNLDAYPEAFASFSTTTRIFDMQRFPLTWLLKVADILQEWDKPKAGEEQKELHLNTPIELVFSLSKIAVRNFPKNKIDETSEVLCSYTSPNNIISFE
jgi:hypothetical protein